MTEPETIEAEVTEQVGQALELAAPANLFRTDDPTEVIRRATDVADVLKRVLVEKDLTKRIGTKDHVLVEGWTLCGTMLGVFPVCVWTRKLEDGWEARVEARTLAGAIVGAAEAECLRSESTWKSRDDYALRSMAQTRATSKALRVPLGFIVTLAGFSATPAEEMPAEERRNEGGLGPAPVYRSWTKIREWYDLHGGEGAWELAELFTRACSYHLYGEVDSKKLTSEQRKVMLQKAAGATVWLAENENTPFGPTASVEHFQKAWAKVLDGAVLEVPEWQPRVIPVPSGAPIDPEAERIGEEVFHDAG